MNAREAMRMKLEIPRVLGASEDLLNGYCPVLPKENPTEFVNEPVFCNTLVREVKVWFDRLHGDADLTLDESLFDALMSTYEICPYCVANR